MPAFRDESVGVIVDCEFGRLRLAIQQEQFLCYNL
jgi:hypothetical protein